MRGATPRKAFGAVVDAALAQIEANAPGALSSDEAQFLHQLRVGLRRLRSALRAFRKILGEKQTKPLRRSLRKLSPKLGAARDWDVLVARLAAARAAPELLARAVKERDKTRQAARRAIASNTFARIVSEARAITAEASAKTLGQFGAAALARAQRKLFKHNHIRWHDPAARHAMRIRVKRLRYSCEFFAPAFPAKRTAAYLADLKALQEILGELNDIAVGRRLVGFDADEAALLRNLEAAWTRFAKRPPFWRAAG